MSNPTTPGDVNSPNELHGIFEDFNEPQAIDNEGLTTLSDEALLILTMTGNVAATLEWTRRHIKNRDAQKNSTPTTDNEVEK